MAMVRFFLVGFFLLLVTCVVFADVAPPPPSEVAVYLLNNGNSETGISQITYHCPDEGYTETGETTLTLDCSAGICRNSPGYSMGYCAYFPYGNFTYEFGGTSMTSKNFNNTHVFADSYSDAQRLNFTLDVLSGEVTLKEMPQPPDRCLPFFILGAIAAFCFFSKK